MNWIANTMENYFTFKGRAQRKEYWYFILFTFIGQTVLTIADIALIYFVGVSAFPNTLFFLVTLIPSITVCVRRLHDTGRSGSAMILFLSQVLDFSSGSISAPKIVNQGTTSTVPTLRASKVEIGGVELIGHVPGVRILRICG